MRYTFDRLLLEKAREAGAKTLEGCRITEVSESSGCAIARSSDGQTFKARFLIDAHGAGPLIGSPMQAAKGKDRDMTLTAEVDADPDEFNGLFGSGKS